MQRMKLSEIIERGLKTTQPGGSVSVSTAPLTGGRRRSFIRLTGALFAHMTSWPFLSVVRKNHPDRWFSKRSGRIRRSVRTVSQ